MNILMLGPYRKDLVAFLSSYGDEIRTTEAPLTRDSQFISDIDLIVSYGYRHILKKDILEVFPNRAINLHISLLPWKDLITNPPILNTPVSSPSDVLYLSIIIPGVLSGPGKVSSPYVLSL